jgi:CubicO group peptidase (beta-lactamase class C family)
MKTGRLVRATALAAFLVAHPLFGAPLQAQLRGSDSEVAAFMDRHVAGEVRRLNIPGAALAVVRDGRVILLKGYGYADIGSGRPMTADTTPVRQLSITKTFVWLLAMQLVEQGRLDLDRDLNAYLDFRIPDGVTMRHLMTHSSGLADPFGVAVTRGATLREDLASDIPERIYLPGSTIAYSNYGPALAAYVLERLHGRPYDDLVTQRILAPVGMSRSTITDPLPRPMVAQSYGASAREPATIPAMGPATRVVGALSAPAIDMARYLTMLQSGGSIISQASLVQMLTLARPLGPGLQAGFGLGFITGHYRGVQHSGHGGSFAGGATDLQLLPEHGLAWTIAFNGRGDNGAAVEARGLLLRAVIDRFAATPHPAPRARGPSTAREVAGYYLSTLRAHSGPGRIMDAFAFRRFRAAPDGALIVEGEAGQTHWAPQGPDRFVEPGTGLALAVTRKPNGEVLRIASPLLNNVAEFEPAPIPVRWAIPLLAVTMPILLIGGVLRLRRRSLASGREDLAISSALPPPVRLLADVGPWVIIGTLLAWLAALLSGLGSGITLIALQFLTIAAILGAISMTAYAGTTLRASGSLGRSIEASVVALAALTTAWLFLAFGLVDL